MKGSAQHRNVRVVAAVAGQYVLEGGKGLGQNVDEAGEKKLRERFVDAGDALDDFLGCYASDYAAHRA